MARHIDSPTGKVFNSEEEYLEHVSPVTGYKPTDLRHQGKRGILVAKASLKRKGLSYTSGRVLYSFNNLNYGTRNQMAL